MEKRHAFLFFLLFACGTFHVCADCISIQLLQKGVVSGISDITLLVESSVMDTFFDRGDIVTSNAIVMVTSETTDEGILKRDFEEAQEGNVDILIVISIDYSNQYEVKQNIVKLSPIKGLTWKVYSVANRKKLYEGILTPSEQELKKDD
ncbi:MAG: hypothetical protein K6E51_09715, partial [Treponema sp.]|nr:hypothetical protein [Treponema sp.]